MFKYIGKPIEWFGNFRDWTVQKIASTFLLKYIDGYKTDITRLIQAITTIIIVLSTWFPDFAPLIVLNDQWYALLLLLSNLGLEFSIQHKKIKAEKALLPHPKSIKRKFADEFLVYESKDKFKE